MLFCGNGFGGSTDIGTLNILIQRARSVARYSYLSVQWSTNNPTGNWIAIHLLNTPPGRLLHFFISPPRKMGTSFTSQSRKTGECCQTYQIRFDFAVLKPQLPDTYRNYMVCNERERTNDVYVESNFRARHGLAVIWLSTAFDREDSVAIEVNSINTEKDTDDEAETEETPRTQ